MRGFGIVVDVDVVMNANERVRADDRDLDPAMDLAKMGARAPVAQIVTE